MLEVETCCWGCSVRTGASILLWLTLIGSGICIVFYWNNICIYQHFKEIHRFGDLSKQLTKEDRQLLRYCAYGGIAISSIALIMSALGIVGIQTNIAGLLMPYLCYLGCIILLYVLAIIFLFVSPHLYMIIPLFPIANLSDLESVQQQVYKMKFVVIYVFGIVLSIYFFIVIRSCLNSIKRDPDE